jgi:hypothetical protein
VRARHGPVHLLSRHCPQMLATAPVRSSHTAPTVAPTLTTSPAPALPQQDDQQEHEGQGPSAHLRPGSIVWAKVEGHDWWPARIVRRRAVPREVGPPPGGPTQAFAFIPVVFFTARGIPGEVEERMDTTEGVLAATCRALGIRECRLLMPVCLPAFCVAAVVAPNGL